MDMWRQKIIGMLEEAETEVEIFQRIVQLTRKLGFDYCAYGVRFPVPISKPATAMLNNYPHAWQQRYTSRDYLVLDPTVRHALRSTSHYMWPAEPDSEREFWEDAWRHGLRYGCAIPWHNPVGVIGWMTFARSHEAIGQKEMKKNGTRLNFLAQVGHEFLSQHFIPAMAPEAAIKLSGREREVLCWTAEGKTSSEIGLILGVAERTVNFHIGNAIGKLRATNKTQAVVKAALFGILNSPL